MTSPQPPTTFFPELHRTSYNNMLGKHLIQHQKRRRSSSVPPRFQPRNFASSNLSNTNSRSETPLVFAQLQVTDPRPVHHPSKAAKVDARPVPIERVHKPQPPPVTRDPVETKKKMDEDLIQLNFEDITVAELKDMLRERGYPTTGKKAVLTDRLKEAQRQLINSRVTASPAIQGFAEMTLNSPVMEKMSTSLPNESIHPALSTFSKDDLDLNAFLVDTDAFPPWNNDDTLFKFSDWDQEQLDTFLTEL
ncbi:hypothetical protein K501DRAFT_49804 [Backusella circina FSU 941]|nr:hypothetical protein K501DRAFT_49804 [Backusella circina FSU 941]